MSSMLVYNLGKNEFWLLMSVILFRGFLKESWFFIIFGRRENVFGVVYFEKIDDNLKESSILKYEYFL